MASVPSTPADGMVKVVYVPTIADPSAPTSTELTGASAKDISCYLTADGWTNGVDEQVITDDRMCSTQTFEQPGRYSENLTIKYIENPTSSTDNVAAVTLVRGTVGYLVERRGVAYDTALAAADKVIVRPIKAGVQKHLAPEANSVLKIEQKVFITGAVVSATVAA